MGAAGTEVYTIAAGPIAVAAVPWRHRGQLHVTVIAKASFAFVPDGVMTRAAPQEIFRDEIQHDDSPVRSPRFTSDLAPYLSQADVLFDGHAYPPPGVRVETLPVRLGLFEGHGQATILDKTLLIQQRGGFESVPIVYERAFGGIGWPENPFGVGALAGSGEPNIVDPFDGKRLAGFGPIGRAWYARKRLLGVTPRRVIDAPLAEIPDSFAWAYFQAAPPDQRVAALRGDEWIVMDSLHPTIARLRTRLPGARSLACVFGLGPWGIAEGQALALHADTLRIEGDEERATLTFRGAFPVADVAALEAVRVVAGVELPGAPIPWPASSSSQPRDAQALMMGETPAQPVSKPASSSAMELSEEDFLSVRGDVLAGTLALDRAPPPARTVPLPMDEALPIPPPTREPVLKTLEVPVSAPSAGPRRSSPGTGTSPVKDEPQSSLADTLVVPVGEAPKKKR